MLDTTIPSLLKYLTLAVSTWIVSNLLAYTFRTLIKSGAISRANAAGAG